MLPKMTVGDKDVAESIERVKRELNEWIEPLQPKERKALDRFCGVVQELKGCSIFQKLLSGGEITLNYKVRNGLLVSAEIRDLDEEPLKAFLLTTRLLAQDNDGSPSERFRLSLTPV